MHFVYATAEAAYELAVDLEGSDARVSDLAGALGAPSVAAAGLFVDGIHQRADVHLRDTGLAEGSVVSLVPVGSAGIGWAGWEPGVYVSVLTGLDAGMAVRVAVEGEYLVGRAPECHVQVRDVTVSRVHCRLWVSMAGTVLVTNESGSGTTRVEGRALGQPTSVPYDTPVLLGTVLVVVSMFGSDDRMAGVGRPSAQSGTVGLNRPPRATPTGGSSFLAVPEEPQNLARAPFNLATLLAPAALGIVMVIALGNLLFGLMAFMSPIMAVGNWWEGRHRSSRNLRGSTREYARQLDALRVSVSTGRERELSARRQASPSLPEVLRRASLPSVRLWERRRWHPDFLQLTLGDADAVWSPDLGTRSNKLPDGVAEVLRANELLPDVPAQIDLSQGGVIGIVGSRPVALALARSLICQAAVLHGPADLRIAVAAADDPERAWEWAKWLPHTKLQTSGRERRLLALGADDTEELFESLAAEFSPSGAPSPFAVGQTRDEGPTTLYVIDGDDLLSSRTSSARRLLGGGAGPAAGIVVAPSVDRLPALCTAVATVTETGEAIVTRLRGQAGHEPVRLAVLDQEPARRAAMALSRFDDPELHVAGASLPGVIRLGSMLGVKSWDAGVVADRWRQAGVRRTQMRAPIGFAEDGRFDLDLDRHGPHGLIGGTTGSGKSELLKTLVAALAATYPPDQLTFGLFDFKGGATFTDFATLPHTVGMASDLDVSLAKRALRCLRAELLYRERVFETAGVKDLVELNDRQALGDATARSVEVLPRLVVIIDEFAAMAKELSEEIGALADLTARGRSLGVHLLLATQKPSTAINAEIRTNTRLRISLQVEDKQDSLDVVGIPDAATINHKGRGYFRVGSSEVIPLQTAWSTGKVEADGDARLTVQEFAFASSPPAPVPSGNSGVTTELQALVESIGLAYRATGQAPQRRPWPDPLPDRITLDQLAALEHDPGVAADDLYFALADDPDRQTTYPVGWPMRSGNLLFFGVVGSGTTTALATVAMAFARSGSPAQRQIYVLDAGAGDLVALEGLPHCAAVIRAAETERQIRLLRVLTQELDRRRGLSMPERAACPTVLVVVDNVEGLRATFEQDPGPTWSRFLRLYADGPETGVYVAASATRLNGVPSALSAATPNKVVLRLADTSDYGGVGLARGVIPTFVPGRAIRPGTASVVQIALPGTTLSEAVAAVAAHSDTSVLPAPIRSLPDRVAIDELAGMSKILEDRWELAIGRRDDDLGPAVLSLYDGEHVFVAGPARSGKSTALLTLVTSLRDAEQDIVVLGFGSRRSPLVTSDLLDGCVTAAADFGPLIDAALAANEPTLLLVDDAELFDDPGGRLAAVLSSEHPYLHVAAAGKADVLRSMFGHWTQTVRRSRAGLLLQPALDRDGELLGARLPGRLQIPLVPGRGFLVCGGNTDLVQVALA